MAEPKLYDLASVMMNGGMEAAVMEIDYLDHRMTARRLARQLGISLNELPGDGLFAADERVDFGTHHGTHLDAPSHYGVVIEGKPARTIDQVSLDWLFHDGVMLDFSHKKPTEAIQVHDLRAALDRINYQLKPWDIVMTRVGTEDVFYDDPNLEHIGAGLNGESIFWLFGQGIRVTATDSVTQDMPIPLMTERFKAGERAAYFPVHRAGGVVEYMHVEKIYGLKDLPGSTGYQVAAFPIKVEGGSGAWARPVAFQGLDFKPDEARLVDLSAPIRRFSMEPQETIFQNHPAPRRRRQWAKQLRMQVSEVDQRGCWDHVVVSTQAGTHMKSPFFFGPQCGGKDALSIEQVPIEWCYGRGVLLDFGGRPAAQTIAVVDLRRELERVGHRLAGGDIVLLRTGAEDYFDADPSFAERGAGLNRASLFWLLDQGVRVIGTDAESLDRPLGAMLEDYREGDRAALFPVHMAAREREHCQVLKLYNLKSLPRATDFTVLLAPIKLERAGSGWVRAVAFVK